MIETIITSTFIVGSTAILYSMGSSKLTNKQSSVISNIGIILVLICSISLIWYNVITNGGLYN